jgi:hypothetical protein
VGDEGEDVEVDVEIVRIAPVPEVGLIHAVADLAHVDRLQRRIESAELAAPGLLVPHALSEGDRIAGAHHSAPIGTARRREVLGAPEAPPVGAKAHAGAVHVFDLEIRQAHPPERRVVAGVVAPRLHRVVSELPDQERVARRPSMKTSAAITIARFPSRMRRTGDAAHLHPHWSGRDGTVGAPP